jgi:hypothetical protein
LDLVRISGKKIMLKPRRALTMDWVYEEFDGSVIGLFINEWLFEFHLPTHWHSIDNLRQQGAVGEHFHDGSMEQEDFGILGSNFLFHRNATMGLHKCVGTRK